jgi:hypothetical protein
MSGKRPAGNKGHCSRGIQVDSKPDFARFLSILEKRENTGFVGPKYSVHPMYFSRRFDKEE